MWNENPMTEPNNQQDSKLNVEKIFVNYRIKCDMAVSELKDNFYTQERYEDAIQWELDRALAQILQLLEDVAPEKYHKEFECNFGTHESFCENQDCPNAPKEYNQGVQDYLDAIRKAFQ